MSEHEAAIELVKKAEWADLLEAENRALREALGEYVEAAVAFEDSRINYIEIQVDRGLPERARALLPASPFPHVDPENVHRAVPANPTGGASA